MICRVLATLLIASMVLPMSASGQTVEVARPIKANSTIGPDDLLIVAETVPGAFTNISDAIGLEARKTLYPGRPIMIADLGPVSIVERNQLVDLVFVQGKLRIVADGRALGRASMGGRVRVMNTDSRLTVTGVVVGPSLVEVRR